MANSYNELFGLGSHSEDASIEGWWKLQETSGTTAADSSTNSRNGTINGMGANPTTTTGPGWFSSAFDFDGSDDYVEMADSAAYDNTTTMSVLARFKPDSSASADEFTIVEKFDNDGLTRSWLWRYDPANNEIDVSIAPDVSSAATATNGVTVEGAWHSGGWTYDGATLRPYLDGSALGTTAAATFTIDDSTTPLSIGYRNAIGTPIDYFAGAIADVSVWSRTLSATEIAQWDAGPEPIYTSGVSFSADGTYSVGTWNSQSNGTATYEVVAANAAGSVIDSASTSSGDLDLSAENGNTVYLLVRATNTGGYDIGDKATRTSAYGSSNDGYYELASVTASDGAGGGPSHASTMLLSGVGF